MSISISVGVQIPTNVVEVGNEISTQQLGAITSGSSPTSANPFTTVSYISGLSYLTTSSASTTYAPKASPTFTGVVTIPAGASISGYLTTATASSTYQTLSGMTSYLTTSAASSTYQPIGSYLTDAPSDGSEYVRKNAAWAVVTGGGGISDAPTGTGLLYARRAGGGGNVWEDFTIPVVPPASVTNIDLTGNFNGYSMGSGYYSFKYDSTANTMRMENGSGGGTSVGAYGIQENLTSVGTSLTLGATDGRILHVLTAFYTISIPSDSTYSFPIGTRFFICSPAGSTVTTFMSSASLNGVAGGSHTLLDGVSTLIKVAADTWFIK
jgi:hypothetical protein